MSEAKLAWLDRVLRDLSAFSADLLTPGLAPTTTLATSFSGASAPLNSVLQSIDAFAKYVPLALDDAALADPQSIRDSDVTPTPMHARPSRRPADYVVRDGLALPRYWLREGLVAAPPIGPLRWLTGLADTLRQQLDIEASRLGKQIEHARFARAGSSAYALADMHSLDQMQGRLQQARQRLQSGAKAIAAQVDARVAPSNALPNPFPRGLPWKKLRVLREALGQPAQRLGPWLGQALRPPIAVADIPYLYQRWCGVQIIHAAQRLGWRVDGDIVGALFLGGLIRLQCEDELVELWVEPRLSAAQAPRIGWHSGRDTELTPDFLFVTGAPGQRDAFVLDATLSTQQEFLAEKTRYRHQLIGQDTLFIAGVPQTRRPLRSWSAAPIRSSHCRVADPQGIGGTIPMDANEATFPALDAWLGDVLHHGRASQVYRLPHGGRDK
jgi:hypothetical protein